jgi:hypothetical protein
MNKLNLNRTGIVFAVAHFVIFIVFVLYINELSSREGQTQLYWLVWLIVDFPVSIVIIISFWLDSYSYDLLYFTHGVLGTVWWYFIGKMPMKKR